MINNPYTPDSAPDELEARMNYMTQKLIVLWRADPDRAYEWLMKREHLVRLFLVAVVRELALDPDTNAGLRADCGQIITYLKNKAA